MIKILGKIPNEVVVACSGGVDSMAVVDFLRNGKKKVIIAHFNHLTEYGNRAEVFVKKYCEKNGLEFVGAQMQEKVPKGVSKEAFWREHRYAFLRSEFKNQFVITCHHLDDSAETWFFKACHGQPSLIPYRNNGVFRPFLLNKKSVLVDWCTKRGVPWLEDPSNQHKKYMRNLIRHELMPVVSKVNGGLDKVISRMIQQEFDLKYNLE